MDIETILQDGHERIVMDRQTYEDLVDARDHAIAMRGVANGEPTFTEAEAQDYVSAATPLAFWRKRSGRTQAELAAKAGITQPFLAQMESGKRDGTIGVLSRIARSLGVTIDDLVGD
jgi:DNA-binding XRE family transcriptional regulator